MTIWDDVPKHHGPSLSGMRSTSVKLSSKYETAAGAGMVARLSFCVQVDKIYSREPIPAS